MRVSECLIRAQNTVRQSLAGTKCLWGWKTQLRLPEAYQYKRKANDYGRGSQMVGAEKEERH